MKKVKIGQKVRFKPFAGIHMTGFSDVGDVVAIGTVKYINEPHRWFSVEYDTGAGPQRISFDFTEIDRSIHICK